MKKINYVIFSVLFSLFILVILYGSKWYNTYTVYKDLNNTNERYVTLQKEIDMYEKAITEYNLTNGINKDNQSKINELKKKINNLNTEIDSYEKKIKKMNSEL